MSTLFTNIYKRTINEFDDPFIKNTYGNVVYFFQVMSGYLINALPLVSIPEILINKVEDITNPIGETELFNGDGTTKTFTLSTTPVSDSLFLYMINNVQVTGTYNSVNNSVTLDSIPDVGTDNVSIEWYYAGCFNQTLSNREERIISYLWVQNWAEKEKNYSLDIKRLLNDTDFKLSNEATNLNAKVNWYSSLREEANNMMKQYSWYLYKNSLRKRYGLDTMDDNV